MRSINKSTIIFLGLGHGINDLVAGYFLGQLIYFGTDTIQVAFALLIYNLLAFGGQYPVASWIEKIIHPKRILVFSYFLNLVAVSVFPFTPFISIVLAGIASAIYHVAGGTICATDNKATSIGLFAAPGVVGLVAGGYFAWTQINIFLELSIAAAVFLVLLSLVRFPELKNKNQEKKERDGNKFSLEQHDLVMILLLVIISMRSVIWNVFQLANENNYEWLIAIAASAFVGKIAGGWLADRIGWRLYVFISLLMAMPLVTFFKNELLLFCIGIGLLQSGIPATTLLLIRSVKGNPARGIGLSFGTAIIVGVIVMYTPIRGILFSDFTLFITMLTMLSLFIWIRREKAIGS